MRTLLRPRLALPLAALVVVAAAAAVGYARQGSGSPSYRLAAATLGTVTQTIPISGNLAPVQSSDLDFTAAGTVQSVSVQVGQSVHAGDVLAQEDPSGLQATLTQAQANLESAQAKLALDQAGPSAQSLQQSQSQVSSAQVTLQNAQTSLSDTQAANQQAVAQDQSAVTAAQNLVSADQGVVSADQDRLQRDQQQEQADCNANPPAGNCSSDQQTVTQDQQRLATDQQTLSRDQSGLVSAQNALQAEQVHAQQSNDQAQAQVNTAQVQLQNAQAALAALQQSITPQQIAMDAATVTVGQVAVQNAQRALDGASLRAPTDGVITAVNIGAGQQVAAGTGSTAANATHAVSMLTPGSFEVTGSISDAQIGQVVIGQAARITPAGASEALNGRVTSVGEVATVTSGVATFPVTVTIDGVNPALRAGTSASIEIIVNQVSQVLTVPTSAVHTAGSASTVQVLAGGNSETRVVQVGASDAQRTQILSGINPGDQVIIATITRSIPTTGSGNGIFGGGRGLGRGGGGGPVFIGGGG